MTDIKHSIRYFGIADDGSRVPCNKSMRGKDWGWDATCAPCGWDSKTGGVVHARIVDVVADHKAHEPVPAGPSSARTSPRVYCGKCGNTERWATGLPSCPKCVPADTTVEDMAVAAAMNVAPVETVLQRKARQARERRAAKRA